METPGKMMGPIVVGIGLDPFFQPENGETYSRKEEVQNLLQAAVPLALKTGAPLRLVSVWEAKVLDMAKAVQRLPNFDWQTLQLDALATAARTKVQENCENQLKQINQELDQKISVSRQVITAKDASQGLLADAETNQASLILLGAGTKADNYFTRGYSTALTVMADTTVPVLVIGTQCETNFAKPHLRVLLADDLRDVTEKAMQNSVDWISNLGQVDLLHLHVEELGVDRVKQILGTATAELRSTVKWEKLSADLMQALDQALHERLQSRTSKLEAFIKKSGGALKHEVRRCGFVRDEIERAADEFKADLIVFGRHQKVHRRPYMVGRITYQAMLSQKRAVLVIP